ncbi:MAG: C4-dicarboxylate ABC transporter substrate-binding protein [Anaerolineae bacterium]|nr:MAG: C4-dicarboxylate ABC transporter substrate-binding protein [Anaerolineae bacterium]
MLKFSRWMDSVSMYLGKVAAFLVILTVAIGFYNVVARYLGRFVGVKLTTNMLIELQWYLFSLIFLLGFPYILKIGENVRVDFLYANWSMKTKAWVNLIGHLFLLTFCIIGIWVTFYPVLQSWGLLPDGTFGQWEVSPDPDGLPRAPIKTMMPIGFALLFLQGLAEIFKNIARIRGEEIPFEGK